MLIQRLNNYRLSLILSLCFMLSWVARGVFDWVKMVQVYGEYGAPLTASEFWFEFINVSLEQWRADFFDSTFFALAALILMRSYYFAIQRYQGVS